MNIIRLRHLGDDTEPAVSIWGDLPFSAPAVALSPVGLDIPDTGSIPGLNPSTSGVSTDDSRMSVVTVTASQSAGLPWWVWAGLAAGGLYLWSKS